MDIAIILPSMGRPEQLRRTVARLAETAPCAEIICVIDEDTESVKAVERSCVVLFRPERRGPISAWNEGAAIATGDVFVVASDDFEWDRHWLDYALLALKRLPESSGMVGFNDLHQDGNVLATNFLVTRDYSVKSWGGVIYCPHYKGFYCDTEATRRAQRDKRYIWAVDAKTEHKHWSNGKAVKDATYSARDQWWKHDEELFLRRQAAGWPNDYPPSFGSKHG
jgi:glycosyltransferase involved in cell wall biosynthesis